MLQLLTVIIVFFTFFAQAELPENYRYRLTLETNTGYNVPLAEICFELEQDTLSASEMAYTFTINTQMYNGALDGSLRSAAPMGEGHNPVSVPLAVACRSALNFLEEYDRWAMAGSSDADFFHQELVSIKWEVAQYLMSSLFSYFVEASIITNQKIVELNNEPLGIMQALQLMNPGFLLSDSSKYLMARQARVFETMAHFQYLFDEDNVFNPEIIEPPIFREEDSVSGGYVYYSSAPVENMNTVSLNP